MSFRLRILLALGLMASPTLLWAQDGPPSALPGLTVPEGSGPVTRLVLALRLQAEAEARQDTMSLAMAAALAREVHMRRAPHWAPEAIPPFADMPPAPPADPAEIPPAAQLAFLQSDEAMASALMAADDALYDALLPLAGSTGWRHTGTATQAEAQLQPGQAQLWRLPFDGQSPAEVSVMMAGPGAALWRVEDAAGTLLCPDQSANLPNECTFTPEENGWFRILVQADAAAPAPLQYLLVTN